MFAAGTCFWISNEDSHVWAVISDPAIDDTAVLIANFTTFNASAGRNDAYNDRACIIQAGEHPKLTHTTCVCYTDARTTSVRHLEWRVETKKARLCQYSLSVTLLTKIRHGAMVSDHMAFDHQQLLIEQGLVAKAA